MARLACTPVADECCGAGVCWWSVGVSVMGLILARYLAIADLAAVYPHGMPAMKKIKIKNISICLIYGVIFGLLISATSILIMGIVEGGISVWINSLKHHGSHTLGVLLFGPFVLGAWLVGALILLSIKLLYIDE